MRVAALYDIHANVPALEAVLADVEQAGADLVLVGGDVALGPMPRETLHLLMELGERARFIRGNADRALVDRYDRPHEDAHESDLWAARELWAAQQLTRAQRDFLAALPEQAVLEIDGLGPVLFCHGSPRSDEEIITAATPESRLREILAGVEQRLVLCGHTHVQFDRSVGETRVVNAGSVGMPYGERGAYWALLGPEVSLERTLYDCERAAERIRRSGFPRAEEFAAENVLDPPAASEATELFERLAAEQRAEG